MTERAEILDRLRELGSPDIDPEDAHIEADSLLCELLADPEIVDAWRKIPKWYS